jgi:hypothetical protein
MDDETKAVVRNVVRESVALAYVGTVLSVWVVSVTNLGYVAPSQIQQAFLDTFFFVFAVAGGYLVFGKQALDAAVDTYQKLTSKGDNS